jgi:uncharacterized protein YjiS (DUF1127 family)
MTTISLSATDALMDLMPGRADPRKAPFAGGLAGAVAARPFRLHLLPRAWREALEHRARQRELEMAFERLAETSPHLLADVGLPGAKPAEAAPAVAWTRALPAPGTETAVAPVNRAAMARSRRRLAELDGHLLRDIGATRAQALQETRRPRWDAPEAWLR